MRSVREIALTNDELASIYDYLNGNITQKQLGKELRRSRTNTYYYVGRAVDYWLQMGLLRFANITKQEELGGKEKEDDDNSERLSRKPRKREAAAPVVVQRPKKRRKRSNGSVPRNARRRT